LEAKRKPSSQRVALYEQQVQLGNKPSPRENLALKESPSMSNRSNWETNPAQEKNHFAEKI
jgi:hypothetical protein